MDADETESTNEPDHFQTASSYLGTLFCEGGHQAGAKSTSDNDVEEIDNRNADMSPNTLLPSANRVAQIADFLLPTEGIDSVIVFGVRRSKVILSARTTDPTIHLGRMLSERWPNGQAGGHKALAGGQVLFESLLEAPPSDPDEAALAALMAMKLALGDLFSRGVDSDD